MLCLGKKRRAGRSALREVALQVLYEIDLSGRNGDSGVENADRRAFRNRNGEFLDFLVEGTLKYRDRIDAIIEENSINWSINRMSVVDRNILRIAVFELVYSPDVPMKVAINEAIELAKRFGSDESATFVNGILDSVAGGLTKGGGG